MQAEGDAVYSLATDLSESRVEFLIRSPWPDDVGEVAAWLRAAPVGRFTDDPEGGDITPATFATHEDRVAGFSWFVTYPDAVRLLDAFDSLGDLVSTLLGVPGDQERGLHRSGYWLTTRFAIETYAHDVHSPGRGQPLRPTLQVYVADAAIAAVQEAIAKGHADD